jgi:glutathione S-transferase
MITVHHLSNSRSQRILWLLEELDLDYEVKRYERDPETMRAPASLQAVHPLGKAPVVTDGDVTLAESGAIIEYLINRHGPSPLAPVPGSREQRRCTYWLHYAEGSAMPPLLLSLIFKRLPDSPMPFFIRPIARAISKKAMASFIDPQLRLHFDYMEAELGKSTWFAGEDFTCADVQMGYPVEAASARGVLDAGYPRLQSYLERIHARPAYQRAVDRGGVHAPLQ